MRRLVVRRDAVLVVVDLENDSRAFGEQDGDPVGHEARLVAGRRYRAELKGNPALEDLRALKGKVTLVYGAKDPKINHAAVLAEVLKP